MVPREVIDELRSRVDIVAQIGDVLPLRKTGRNFTGLCPFHSEKSPSFVVSSEKQLYHCFGCGEGGTVITFLTKYYRLSFPEVLDRLASIAGVDLKRYQTTHGKEEADSKKKLRVSIQYAREAFHRAFGNSEQGREARDYAAKRGISSHFASELKLGYAPDSWDAFVQALQRDQQSLEDACSAGLIGRRRGGAGYYDWFRHRFLFPIENEKGVTVGFGGRTLGRGTPKYLNSPQTLLFDKGKTLYNLYHAAEAIRQARSAILVEGYMDCVMLRQVGLKNVVATMGTALTGEHVKLLMKYTDEVVLVFDGDHAGLQAVRRSAHHLLAVGLRTRVVLLPDALDPDQFVRAKGAEAFEQVVKEATPLLPFFIQRFYASETDVGRKALALEELAEIVRSVQSTYLQQALAEEAARLATVDKAIFLRTRPVQPVARGPKIPLRTPGKMDLRIAREELVLLRLAVQSAEFRDRLIADQLLDHFSSERLRTVAIDWLNQLMHDEIDSNAARVVDAWQDEESRPLLSAALLDPALEDPRDSERVWKDCVRKLRAKEIHRLAQSIAQAETSGDEETVFRLEQKLQDLKRNDARAPQRGVRAEQGRSP